MTVEELQAADLLRVVEAASIVDSALENDGNTWTVQIIQAGFGQGELNNSAQPHYFPPEILPQFASAANNARFGRRHPGPIDTEDDPARIAGYFTDAKVVNDAVQAKLHLFPHETEIREKLVAAKKVNRLNLFGLSILAYCSFKPGTINGVKALVSETLKRLVSVDFVCEAGAGGKFLVKEGNRNHMTRVLGSELDLGPRKDVRTASIGLEPRDKAQLAMDGLMGVREARKSSVRPFRGIKEAFLVCTGETDCSRIGRGAMYNVSEAIATTDFPNILLNSMTKRLIQDYAQIGMGGMEKIITPANIADYKVNDRVRMGYLGDLPIVAEAATYTELVKPTDEKISYAVVKRGGVLTISEETIRNDDNSGVAAFPERLARAGRRTLKQFITSIFLTNPNYDPDGIALFNAAHGGNTTVNPLSSANLDAAEALMMAQTEKDSTKPLNLPLQWVMVPTALKATAYQINNNASATNAWFERLGANHEQPQNLIVNELLASATRWWGGCYPDRAPGIEIGYLDGAEEPQLFIASGDFSNLNFTNSQIVFKSRFVFGGKPLDFRFAVQNN